MMKIKLENCVATTLVLVFVSTVATLAEEANKPTSLPEGNSGIASKHPGDVGIDRHASVVFVENFNGDLQSLKSRWDAVKAEQILSLSPECAGGQQWQRHRC